MKADVRKKSKNNLQKIFLKLMNSADFGKTMQDVKKYRNTKLVTAKARSYYLFLEPNYRKTIFFENLLVMEMKNTQVHMIEEEDSNV